MSNHLRRGRLGLFSRLILAGALPAALLALPLGSSPSRPAGGLPAEAMNYDIRVQGGGLIEELERGYPRDRIDRMNDRGRAWSQAFAGRLAGMRRDLPQAVVELSPVLGGPEVVRAGRGFLTAAARGRSGEAIARAFLGSHAGTLGLTTSQVDRLRLLGESPGGRSGLRMVRLEQTIGGVPVFQGEIRALVDRDGRLVRIVGRMAPEIDESAVPAPAGMLSARDALRTALLSIGIDVDAGALGVRAPSSERADVDVVSADPRIVGRVPSWIVYFPLRPGVAVPAWAQVIRVAGPGAWLTVVDGRTGFLVFRKNLRSDASTQPARFSVYARDDDSPADSPAPGAPNALQPGSGTQFPAIPRRIVDMLAVQDPIASPNGWIPDGGDSTIGNNADAFLTRSLVFTPDVGTLDRDGRAVGNPDAAGRNRDFLGSAPRNFNYTPAPAGPDPDAGDDPSTPAFQRGGLAHAFYVANYFHDLLYRLGWDEAAGNAQENNFGRGGLGNDPVEVGLQFGANEGYGEDAFSICDPDGLRPSVGFTIFPGPDPDREAALDAGTVLHELTHNLTCRLVGNAAGLNWAPGGGMGEGWSDFYALAILYGRSTDDPDAQYPLSPYIMYKAEFGRVPPGSFVDNYVYGIRRFPMSTDGAVNPLTWEDADPVTYDMSGGFALPPFGWEQAGAAEVHQLGEIWAVSLWEVRSRIIAAHGGDVAAGNESTLQIVTDALKLTPPDPTFIQARDALLDADCATNACANEASIWGGFADRGLGYGSSTSLAVAQRTGVRASFSLPFLDAAGVMIGDAAGNNNSRLDPGETATLTVTLLNPWKSASKGIATAQATLSTQEAGVTILDASSSYGPIAAGGTAAGDPFSIRLDSGAACGRSLRFNLDTVSALGSTRTSFTLRVGSPAGTGTPVTLSRVIPGGLAILNLTGIGVADVLSVAQDLEIADLDFRLDELRHTSVGDLTVMLRSPDGMGGDLIWLLATCSRGTCNLASNTGDDFIGTIIDDEARKDLYTLGTRRAPFTGRFFPVFNSPKFTARDPVRQLNNWNGRGTKGDWHVFVSDVLRADTGTLHSWSLIVTPVSYTCGP